MKFAVKRAVPFVLASLLVVTGCSTTKPEDNEPKVTTSGTEVTTPVAVSKYNDGTYTGVAAGRNGDISVTVTVVGGVIATVTVDEHMETEGIADPAMETISDLIVAANDPTVDAVSGATLTSNAIMEAVRVALEGAK